jgi:hypothetical protein
MEYNFPQRTIMDKKILTLLMAALVALAACSSGPSSTAPPPTTAETKPAAPPEAVAAKNAFYAMYKPARTWATDLLPLSLASGEVPGVKNEGGKAGKWTAVFVSPSKREARTFTYLVADSGSELKGVDMGGPQPWSPTPDRKPFQTTEFQADSDAAYQEAAKKAADWLAKNPGKKCTMTLANASKSTAPLWYVLWGDMKTGYLAHVNATTGTLATVK